jgi:hypothetical protein
MFQLKLKKLITEKRRARARWHRSQAPTHKTTYNHISNRLKCKIKEERDKSFTDYILIDLTIPFANPSNI